MKSIAMLAIAPIVILAGLSQSARAQAPAPSGPPTTTPASSPVVPAWSYASVQVPTFPTENGWSATINVSPANFTMSGATITVGAANSSSSPSVSFSNTINVSVTAGSTDGNTMNSNLEAWGFVGDASDPFAANADSYSVLFGVTASGACPFSITDDSYDDTELASENVESSDVVEAGGTATFGGSLSGSAYGAAM